MAGSNAALAVTNPAVVNFSTGPGVNHGKLISARTTRTVEQGCDRRSKVAIQTERDLGHRLESTVRYLGIEVDDALEMAEQTEI